MSFFDSEVERSFLKMAQKKGWVTKEDPKIIRTASVEKIAATGNVDVDICRLIDGLRAKGHEKQASDLEKSFLEYKRAESGLYNVSGEDGEKFLEMAHPEGNFKVEEASDENGDVETLLSAHKKIREIALKEPTGDSKKKSLAQVADFIVKNAADTNSLSSLLSGFSFNITMDMLMDMAEENGGPFYNFINVNFHDLFLTAVNYYRDVYIIYGQNAASMPGTPEAYMMINHGLNSDPVKFLNSVQSLNGFNTSKWIGKQAEAGWWDWVWSMREEIASDIHRQFQQKYSGLGQQIKQANDTLNTKLRQVTDGLKSTSRDPQLFMNYLEQIAKSGQYKFLHNAIVSIYGQEYENSLVSAVQADVAVANELMPQEAAPQPTQAPAKSAQDLFLQASRLLMSEMKNPADASIAQENAGIVYQLATAVNSGDMNTIKRVFSQNGITVNSMDDVAAVAQQWIAWAKEKVKA